MSTRRTLTALIAGAALSLGACSSGSTTATPSTTASSPATTTTSMSTTTTEATTTTETTTETTTTTSTGAAAAGDVKAYCDAVKSMGTTLQDPTAAMTNAAERQKLLDGITKVVAVAPDAVKPSWTTFKQVIEQVGTAMTSGDTKAMQDLMTKVQQLQGEMKKITTYTKDNCSTN